MNSISTKPRTAYGSAEENKTLQFVSLFIHDLEGPLVALKSLLRLLYKDRFDVTKPAHQTLLGSCKIAIERAEALVFDLLTAARAGTSELVVEMEPCSVQEVISNSCSMARPAAAEYKVSIEERLPVKALTVEADRLLLNRVLDNLIFNAIRHTPIDGEVIVEAVLKGKYVEFAVTDAGPGINKTDPDELFTIYKQAEYRSRGLHRGVGIGLYFCRLAVETMGGTIRAENIPDRGATIRFTIPAGREGK